MEAPRYTAKEIEDGLYSGMDPDVELVAAQYYDALAAENTELRGKLDDVRMGIGCARGQRTTQYCADLTQRDEVIRRLLAMLKPGEKPNCMDPKYNPAKRVSIYDMDCLSHQTQAQIYARALEIAGRTE